MELPSNWGRWGEDDERGTLNLITEEVRERAAREVRTGRSVSLALPIQPTPLMSGPFAPGSVEESPVQQIMMYTPSPTYAMADLALITNHHPRSTHLDALGHMVGDGLVYPGRSLGESVTPAGARHGSTAAFAEGIVTRGVLLDLAMEGPLPSAYPVGPADLEAAEQHEEVRLEAGDALVVRCGWTMTPTPDRPLPGITLDAVRWMHERGVSVYAGDIGDAVPPLDAGMRAPLHLVGLHRLGLPLVDSAKVDDLAAVCAQLSRYSFLFTAAPPRIHGMTGIAVNPLAIF
ncbi:MAG TPA: cyclase family protein [Pseudonocardiaceae bacterium]|jgi:kynurenine formamidase|nr:cyclase family protein [Pseudonocardiaceae bacterium]